MKYATSTHRHAAVSTSAWMIAEFAKAVQLYNLSEYALRDIRHILEHAERIQFIETLSIIYGSEILTGEDFRTIYKAAKDGTKFEVISGSLTFATDQGQRWIDGFTWENTAQKIVEYIEKWRRERADQDTATSAARI